MKTINSLVALLTRTQAEIPIYVSQQLNMLKHKPVQIFYKEGSYAFFKYNSNAPVLVAHMDTINDQEKEAPALHEDELELVTETTSLVSRTSKWNGADAVSEDGIWTETILRLNKNTMHEKRRCLGADDRAGIFAILEIAKELDASEMPNILLLNDEEIGCVGARDFILEQNKKDKLPFEIKNNFMIEFDRRGDDVVFYDTDSKEFQDLMKTAFNRDSAIGSSSDIRQFQGAWKINSANVAVGYSNEHTKNEHIVLETLFETIKQAVELFKNKAKVAEIQAVEWKEKPVYVPTYYRTHRGYGYNPKAATLAQKDPSTIVKDANSQKVLEMFELLESMTYWYATYRFNEDSVEIDIDSFATKSMESMMLTVSFQTGVEPNLLAWTGKDADVLELTRIPLANHIKQTLGWKDAEYRVFANGIYAMRQIAAADKRAKKEDLSMAIKALFDEFEALDVEDDDSEVEDPYSKSGWDFDIH